MNWLEKYLSSHIRFKNIVIFGFNAMALAVNVETERWGYICFRPTIRFRGMWWQWYFYLSPDGTPHRSTFAMGPGISKLEKLTASIRHHCFGHNFEYDEDFCDWNRQMIDNFEALRINNQTARIENK